MSLKAYLGVARGPFLVLPFTLVAVGSGVAAFQGSFNLLHALLALVGLVALHAAVNAYNEASDFKTGIDFNTVRTPFSGGSGTLPAGQLSHGKALALGIAGSAIGLGVGIYFLIVVGLKLLPIMIVGLVSVLFYTNFLARSYVGEIFAGLGLGNMPVLGTILVQTGRIDAVAIAASVPAFFMTFNLLLLNEFPDIKADQEGGRRNLVLLLNKRAAAAVYAAAALMVPACIIAAVLLEYLPAWGLLALIPSLFLVAPLRWAMTGPERPVPEQALGANVVWNLATNMVLAGALLL
jgi:1,4-dihydroxy-2-naphthoate octaprenyltransferase